MLPSEKEALVELLNAHTNKIVTLVGANPNVQHWTRENIENRLTAAERDFLAEPQEVIET